MTTPDSRKVLGALGRTVIAVLFLAAIVISGRFTGFWDGAGFTLVLGGTAALTLMGFPISQIKAGARLVAGGPFANQEEVVRPVLWEALARNFWVLGALGTVISFVINLVLAQGGIQDMSFRLASSFRPAVYGLALGIFCGLPALRVGLAAAANGSPDRPAPPGRVPSKMISRWRLENGIGLILLLVILFGTIFLRLAQNPTRNFPPWRFFLDWPALLVVGGGTFVLTVFIGPKNWGASITLGSALMGFAGAFVGFVQVMLAISRASITNVAGSIAFVVSSSFLALLIMALVGLPLSDWERRSFGSGATSPLVRLSWFVFPLLVLVFLVLAFILVLTPFQKPA